MINHEYTLAVSRQSPSIVTLRGEWREQYPIDNPLNFREWLRERVGAVSIKTTVSYRDDKPLLHLYQLSWSNEADMLNALLSFDFDVLTKTG